MIQVQTNKNHSNKSKQEKKLIRQVCLVVWCLCASFVSVNVNDDDDMVYILMKKNKIISFSG